MSRFDPDRPLAPDPHAELPPVPSFTLVSDDIEDGKPLRRPQTVAGGGVTPRLRWSGFPQQTRSFLLTVFDADAPRGGLWHWVVADIPPTVTHVLRGASTARTLLPGRAGKQPLGPDALYLPNSLGLRVFLGAAPPKGDRPHRYYVAVHALDVPHLDLPNGARTKPPDVAAAALPHTLARAVIVGTYQQP